MLRSGGRSVVVWPAFTLSVAQKTFSKSPSALCEEQLLGRFSYSEKLFDNVLKVSANKH